MTVFEFLGVFFVTLVLQLVFYVGLVSILILGKSLSAWRHKAKTMSLQVRYILKHAPRHTLWRLAIAALVSILPCMAFYSALLDYRIGIIYCLLNVAFALCAVFSLCIAPFMSDDGKDIQYWRTRAQLMCS